MILRKCLLFLMCVAPVYAPAAGGARKPTAFRSFTLRTQTDNAWSIEYVPGRFPSANVEIDGIQYTAFAGDASSEDGEDGRPQLPVEVLSLGIPSGKTVSAELVDLVYDTQENQLIAPKPAYVSTDEKQTVAVYKKDEGSYSRNRFSPSQQIIVETSITLRMQRVSTIRIFPFQYNPVTRSLRRIVRATLNIHLTGVNNSEAAPVRAGAPGADPRFEEVYRSLLFNYEQAKQWRMPLPGPSPRRAGPGGTWFETGRIYYRIQIYEDGWYKLTKADLVSAGADPSPIDPATITLFSRGVQVPIVVRPDTSIEFYAIKNYGDSTFIDYYTDTSNYFLTWGGSPGLRIVSSAQPSGAPGSAYRSSQALNHYEQNTAYYTGATQQDITQNGEVPGEGWVWDFYYPNTTKTYSFALDTLDGAGGPASTLRARLFGTTTPAVTHDAKFWVNDSLVGEVTFPQRSEGKLSATFPTAWLKIGANRLKVTSIPSQGTVNQFYLDWYEVTYQRRLFARNDQLMFTSPASSGGSIAQFTVNGFTTTPIEVFDLGGGRTITGGTVTGNSLAGYSITFQDTFSTARNYLVVSASGAKRVPSIAQKTFTDIRTNPTGADYIIITHKLFLDAAQTLATHRQSTNALRTKVIDVQDIYDEFNYGVMNSTTIKAFLRYAFENWPRPAPTYVLMFGDASWDFHRYLPTSVESNFVPAYGVPAGDNWYCCFDSINTFIPSLLIGRITVQNPAQAQRVVAKLVGYDLYTLGEWNKNFLMISGGSTAAEWPVFNALSDNTIDAYLSPPPIGGTAFRVYKSTIAVIDGEHKQEMLDLLKRGVSFLNFLGHSGGRIWGVDIGSPDNFDNTSGMLPFVSSVSCDVGAFAEPSANVLSEDFVLADNRGGIACWSASSLGYAIQGQDLVNFFLSGVADDSIRAFGALTTAARLKLWQAQGSGSTTLAMVNLTPLIGDPLSRLTIPLQADLALSADDIAVNTLTPTPDDSALGINVRFRNYGLVPPDSVTISMTDLFNGQLGSLLSNLKVGPTLHYDSIFVPWTLTSQVGVHTLTASLDPGNAITEVTKSNNIASTNAYVYANQLAVIKPLNAMVVSPGPVTLMVTSPVGLDTLGFQYVFEVDTSSAFDSPSRLTSGSIAPGPVSGQWTTPPFPQGQVYFWRARTSYGSLIGKWVTSSFSTASDAPALPAARVREYTRRQFAQDVFSQASATDSGVTIAPRPPLQLLCRSLGYRSSDYHDYSTIGINEVVVRGYWWDLGTGFMVVRVNDYTGEFDFKAFNVPGQSVQADSMAAYIMSTPAGNYVAVSVIWDGRTNVTEGLKLALESLGSTRIRQVAPGQSWALIARKGTSGPAMQALESLNNDTAIVGMQVPNYYAAGSGSVTSRGISTPVSWSSLHWRPAGPQTTDSRLALLGVRGDGRVDTLRVLPKDSLDVDLHFLNPVFSGPAYTSLRTMAMLSSGDPLVTPVLREWWVDFDPSADLAISARTIAPNGGAVQRGGVLDVPVTVYNQGYRVIDSARVLVSMYDRLNKARPIASAAIEGIPVDGSRTISIPISTANFPRRVTIQFAVSPSKKEKDLVQDNNVAYYSFNVAGAQSATFQLFADGIQLMDGDYVSSRPKLLVRVPETDGQNVPVQQLDLLVDRSTVASTAGHTDNGKVFEKAPRADEFEVAPVLSNGRHELTIRLAQVNSFGEIDTLEHTLAVNVMSEARILQCYNFPNPFPRDTYFTFVITGDRPPEELHIRVFTVAGRKVKEILVPQSELQIGFNRIYWDGRDADGDEVANGYYLYQVSFTSQGRTESRIDKLAKVR